MTSRPCKAVVGTFAVIAGLMTAVATAQQTPSLPREFTFAELSLSSDLNDVAKRYPGSSRVGDHLYIDPENEHHISGIGLSGTNQSRRLKVSFESRRPNGEADYPTCAAVQRGIETRYGPPTTTREFDEEASRRSDRVWRTTPEEMTLVCFLRGRRLFAEALVISRR